MVLNSSRDRIVVYEILNSLNIEKFVLKKIREFADYELESIYDNINDFDVVLKDSVLHFTVIFQASNKIKLFSWSPDLPADINGSALLNVNEKFTAPTMNLNEIKCLVSKPPQNPAPKTLKIGCVFITGRNRLYEFFYTSYNNRTYEIDQNLPYYVYYEYKNYEAKSVRLSQSTIFLSSVPMNPVIGSHRPLKDPEELVVTYTRENRVSNYASGILVYKRMVDSHGGILGYRELYGDSRIKREFVIVEGQDGSEALFILKSFCGKYENFLGLEEDRKVIQLFTVGDNSLEILCLEDVLFDQIKMVFWDKDGTMAGFFMSDW